MSVLLPADFRLDCSDDRGKTRNYLQQPSFSSHQNSQRLFQLTLEQALQFKQLERQPAADSFLSCPCALVWPAGLCLPIDTPQPDAVPWLQLTPLIFLISLPSNIPFMTGSAVAATTSFQPKSMIFPENKRVGQEGEKQ